MITHKMKADKFRQVLLVSLFLLSIFCLPAFNAGTQPKIKQVIQTELLLTNVQQEGRWLVFANTFLPGGNLQQSAFKTPGYTEVLQYYQSILETRFKDLAVQRLHFCRSLFFISARITSQYPDEEFFCPDQGMA